MTLCPRNLPTVLLCCLLTLPAGASGAGTGATPITAALPDGVVFEAARSERIAETVRLRAEIGSSPEGRAEVASPVPAYVVSLAERGTRLLRGAAVARLRQAVAPPPDAIERARRAGTEADKLAELAAQGLIPAVRADNARAEADRLAKAIAARSDEQELESPMSATVEALLVRVGQLIDAGQPIARLVDYSQLEVRAALPEAFAWGIRPGAEATVRLAGNPELPLPASLTRIGHEVEPVTRTVEVAFTIQGELPDTMRSGLSAVVEVATTPAHLAVTIPRSALLARGGELVVVVRTADDIRTQTVRTGARSGDRVEITAGLKEGEAVVSSGAALLVAPAWLPAAKPLRASAWLVVPQGRGPALAAALPPDAVAFTPEPPRRALLDARAMLNAGLTLGRVVEALDAGATAGTTNAAAAEGPVVIQPGPVVAARRWRPSAKPEPVDVLAVITPDARALLAAARSIDPETELIGIPSADGWRARLLMFGGLLVVLLGTGSLRAAAALLLTGLVLGEVAGVPENPLTAAATALTAVAAAIAVVTAIERARDDAPHGARGLARAALLLSLLAAGAVVALTQPGDVPLELALLGLLVAASAAAGVTLFMGGLPSASSFQAAPLERLPAPAVAILSAVLGVALLRFSAVPEGSAAITLPGAATLDSRLLNSGLDRIADAAIHAGARSVVTAPIADGALALVLSGPRIERIAEAASAAALPGLGIHLAASEVTPDPLSTPSQALVGSSVLAAEGQLADGLRAGPFLHRGLLLDLTDPGDAGLIPLAGKEGSLVLAREWAAPPVPALLARGPGPRFAEAPVAQSRAFAATAGLTTLLAVLLVIARERMRGASPRVAHAGTAGFVARIAAAGPGAAAIAARGLPQGQTGAGLLLGWALALALAEILGRRAYTRRLG